MQFGVYHHLKVTAETIYVTGGGTLRRVVSVAFLCETWF